MTSTNSPTTRLTCRAPHPDARRQSEICGALMADVIGQYEFVGIVRRIPEVPDGYAYQRCPDKHCRAVNKFRLGAASEDGSCGDHAFSNKISKPK